jgi:hypothetical protein
VSTVLFPRNTQSVEETDSRDTGECPDPSLPNSSRSGAGTEEKRSVPTRIDIWRKGDKRVRIASHSLAKVPEEDLSTEMDKIAREWKDYDCVFVWPE